MNEYRFYYTSKYDMFVITQDDGTLTGKYETDLYCKNEVMANKVCDLLNKDEQLKNAVEEFIENPTQHNLWKLRTILKDGDRE